MTAATSVPVESRPGALYYRHTLPGNWKLYHEIMERRGVSPDFAKSVVRTRNTVIGALMLRRSEADAMLCGSIGQYRRHLKHLLDILGLVEGARSAAAL